MNAAENAGRKRNVDYAILGPVPMEGCAVT